MIRHLHGPLPRGVVPDVVCSERPLCDEVRNNGRVVIYAHHYEDDRGLCRVCAESPPGWPVRAGIIETSRNAPTLVEPDEPTPVVVHHPATPLAIGACCPHCGVRA